MNRTLSVFLTILLTVGGTSHAFADAEANQSYMSVMGSFVDDDDDRGVDDGLNGGQVSIGHALNERWNIEGLMSIATAESDTASRPDENHFGLGVDLQRVFNRSGRFNPYVHAGVGYLTNKASAGPKNEGKMYSYGVGFLMDIASSNVALRAEWRRRHDDATSTTLQDDIFSIGLHVPFGAATPKFVDSDGDGIADGLDRCPNTPAGTDVDAYGCALDSDGDGVTDLMDNCPGTPAGVQVDAVGCALDGDGDGISDDIDKCPATPAGATVGPDGCQLDGDNDGVVDADDQCPNSAPNVQVDIRGCEIKGEISLQGVNFETNSDRLASGATRVLDDAAATLRKNPEISVEVAGHTDSDGAADYNESLSARRATTVHDYLVGEGVSDDRMTVRGYGESQPVAGNDTAAGKAQNRRVVLRITDR